MGAGRAVGLLLGVTADAVLADPRRGHPVAAFGTVASRAERLLYRDRRTAGVLYVGVLVGGAAAAGAVVDRLCRRCSPVFEAAATAVTTWAVLGGASLSDEGEGMARALDAGELETARQRLGNLCGRAADELDERGLARATVESVAENTSDAVVAPLFWGAVAGVPGLAVYRAANTLDAMVGRRSVRYRRFGWAAARLDDALNLLPSRACAALTAVCAPVVGGSPTRVWHVWRRDASAHPSPNAGQVEAAFAGALGARLGGRIVYRHATEQRPVLGDGRDADVRDVAPAARLSRVIAAASALLAAGAVCCTAAKRDRASDRLPLGRRDLLR